MLGIRNGVFPICERICADVISEGNIFNACVYQNVDTAE